MSDQRGLRAGRRQLGALVLAVALVVGQPAVLTRAVSSQLAERIVAGRVIPPAASGSIATVRTDGAFVVWVEVRGVPRTLPYLNSYDLYAVDLQTDQRVPVATGGPGSRSDPAVAGGMVVWAESSPECPTCNRDILARSLTSDRQVVIAATAADETRPAISGDLVVWVSADGATQRLLGRNIRTMGKPFVIAEAGSFELPPRLDGDRVVWVEGFRGSDGLPYQRLLTRRIGAGEARVIGQVGPGADTFRGYDLAGDLLVYAPGSMIRVFNLRTGEDQSLPATGLAYGPTTDGRYAFWGEAIRHRNPSGVVRGYDLATSSAFIVPPDEPWAAATWPHTAGSVLVWRLEPIAPGSPSVPLGLYAAPIGQILPSARRPALASPSPDRAYFPETGHTLAAGFKGFWEANGGLPVFGFPLTEEFSQRNAGTGEWHAVLYLERQRFEYHPDLAGTPYEVLLGRLGVEEVAQRADLRGLWAFNPVPADAQHPAGCRYVPETRHRLCGEFRPYWERHGLELGDPGVSSREALALFGYPISEEFIDPATGLVTQYFERARFEWHPNNPAPYRVLLGRLAADRLAKLGWQ